MPYQMMHLLIADAYAVDKPWLSNNADFYLGIIAPDAIHMRAGNITDIDKYGTHLKPTGPDGLREVTAYWMEQTRTPFHIGYGVHVITDRLWTRHYPTAFPALMRANGSTITEIYRPDADWVDRTLQSQSPNSDRLLHLLSQAVAPPSHPLLTTAEIDQWRWHVMNEYMPPKPPAIKAPRIMNVDAIKTFMVYAVDRLTILVQQSE